MRDGMVSIILGIVFFIVAVFFIYIQKGISIWTGLLIALSILDVITGYIRLKK